VDEVGIGAHGENFAVLLPEALEMLAQILQLRGTDEGKVGGVEKEYGPMAQEILLGVKTALAPAVAVDGKGSQRLADQMTHGGAPFI
jgi:hypothetical protein